MAKSPEEMLESCTKKPGGQFTERRRKDPLRLAGRVGLRLVVWGSGGLVG